MSKSLGNLVTIDEFLERRSSDILRMLIFSGHYRKPVVFNDESLDNAERGLARLRSALRPASGGQSTGADIDTLREATENARARFIEAMDSDFNTSGGLAALFELVRAINTARAAGAGGPFYEVAQRTLRDLAGVLGIGLEGSLPDAGDGVAVRPFIDLLVAVRGELRTAKQWQLSDRVRDGLKELGVVLEDSREGTTWRFEDE
jgi:cysteinyl-tRNA synthetase